MWSKSPRARERLADVVETPFVDVIDSPHAQRDTRTLIHMDVDPTDSVPGPRWFATWDPRARKAALAMFAGLGLVIAWWWWSGQPEQIQPVEQSMQVMEDVPLEEVGGVVLVHVVGDVVRPGIVELPDGARVNDAIEAAGGATKSKALASVNLARLVVDGEQIVVGATSGAQDSGVISINSSSADELDELPGVGPVIAERIVQWRETNGPFRSVDELTEVSGIGPAMLEQLRGQVGM